MTRTGRKSPQYHPEPPSGAVQASFFGVVLAAWVLLQPGAAGAQGNAWTFSASTYGWLAGTEARIDTPRGAVETSVDAADALSDLDFALMGTLEARRGRWGLIGDLVYTDVTSNEPTPFGVLFSRADVRSRLLSFSGYALYRVYDAGNISLDLGAGLRAVSLEIDTRLRPGVAAGLRAESSDQWIEPLLAGRAMVTFGSGLFLTATADVGGFGGDSATSQAFASVGYRFGERWSAQAGYRYLRLEQDLEGTSSTTELAGPLFGVTLDF